MTKVFSEYNWKKKYSAKFTIAISMCVILSNLNWSFMPYGIKNTGLWDHHSPLNFISRHNDFRCCDKSHANIIIMDTLTSIVYSKGTLTLPAPILDSFISFKNVLTKE